MLALLNPMKTYCTKRFSPCTQKRSQKTLISKETNGCVNSKPVAHTGCFDGTGVIAGYSIVQKQDTQLYLFYVGTAESMRGKGVASTLLRSIRDWFLTTEFEKMHLTVAAKNEGAQRIYERADFVLKSVGIGMDTGIKEDALK